MLLNKVRAQIMRNGSGYEVARLQLLSAQCRLAMLPAYTEARPLQLQMLQPHILPALNDALSGFGKLRACWGEANTRGRRPRAALHPRTPRARVRVSDVTRHLLSPSLSVCAGCYDEMAALLYVRARIWNSVGSIELRERDAHSFARAEQEALKAASRPTGRVLDFAEPGALEAHMEQLQALDAEAQQLYGGAASG